MAESAATVDIIIPAYNAARYLPTALDSVIAQSFKEWRILLIDDGSTDATAKVAEEYVQKLGPKLEYIYQKNRGMSAARNVALRAATADYLAFLDADDLWLPFRLEESLARFKERPEAGLVHGYIARMDEQGKVLDTFDQGQAHEEGKIARYLYTRETHLPCPTITVRRQCLNEVGLFDETLRATEDRDLWLRIALRYEVAIVPRVIAQYRTSPNGMTTDLERMMSAQRVFLDKHYGEPGCGFIPRQIALSTSYRERAEALAGRGRLGSALASALRALCLYPFSLANARTSFSLLSRCLRIR